MKFLKQLKNEREFKEGNHQKLLLETLLKLKDCQLSHPAEDGYDRIFYAEAIKRTS